MGGPAYLVQSSVASGYMCAPCRRRRRGSTLSLWLREIPGRSRVPRRRCRPAQRSRAAPERQLVSVYHVFGTGRHAVRLVRSCHHRSEPPLAVRPAGLGRLGLLAGWGPSSACSMLLPGCSPADCLRLHTAARPVRFPGSQSGAARDQRARLPMPLLASLRAELPCACTNTGR
jgi:hypothetical protein